MFAVIDMIVGSIDGNIGLTQVVCNAEDRPSLWMQTAVRLNLHLNAVN